MWHQGENDMFDAKFKPNYGKNLKNFLARWRHDLKTPKLKFYIGELCTKTIWGMDNRENMYAIRAGQRAVTETDPQAEYIPTCHDAVEIGGGEGLHYHYGTLGQLEHGVNYADAYLRTIGMKTTIDRPLKEWPYKKGSTVRLFVLAGHRNMEGERGFRQDLETLPGTKALANDDKRIAFKYSIGGGYKTSNGWEPLGPAGFYDTFGPELSFGKTLQEKIPDNIAIAKFTHSGSQINDWTPEGTDAEDRNLYPQFIAFIQESLKELHAKGLLPKDKFIICNGYKRPMYQEFIVELIQDGFENLTPILDSKREINYYKEQAGTPYNVVVRDNVFINVPAPLISLGSWATVISGGTPPVSTPTKTVTPAIPTATRTATPIIPTRTASPVTNTPVIVPTSTALCVPSLSVWVCDKKP